eukprot:m.223524 g.223524  ORF g.223524 m.223524 type:complete len:337 (+) comp15943_c0_seq25:1549-2559(+)
MCPTVVNSFKMQSENNKKESESGDKKPTLQFENQANGLLLLDEVGNKQLAEIKQPSQNLESPPVIVLNDLKGHKILDTRNLMRTRHVETCHCCGASKTRTWRRGPDGVTVCNACGIRWLRHKVSCKACKYIPKNYRGLKRLCPKCGNSFIVKRDSKSVPKQKRTEAPESPPFYRRRKPYTEKPPRVLPVSKALSGPKDSKKPRTNSYTENVEEPYRSPPAPTQPVFSYASQPQPLRPQFMWPGYPMHSFPPHALPPHAVHPHTLHPHAQLSPHPHPLQSEQVVYVPAGAHPQGQFVMPPNVMMPGLGTMYPPHPNKLPLNLQILIVDQIKNTFFCV